MAAKGPRICHSQAICLRTQEFRETSRIVVAYTEAFGKVRLLVRGVRGPRALASGYLEPVTRHEMVFYPRRKPDLFLLSQWDLLDPYAGIRKALAKIAHAAYACELVDGLTPLEEPQPELFALLRHCLEWMNRSETIKRAVRVLEVKVLTLTGLLASLRLCVACGRPAAVETARYSALHHGPVCPACRLEDPQARALLPGTLAWLAHVQEAGLAAVERIRVAREVGQQVEQVMRAIVSQATEGRLRSAPFLAWSA